MTWRCPTGQRSCPPFPRRHPRGGALRGRRGPRTLRGAGSGDEHVPPALPARGDDSEGSGRAQRLYRLGQAHPHRLRGVPGVFADSGKTEVWHHTEKRDFVLPGREKEHTDAGEKCIQGQFGFGADVMMCLDYCTRPDDTPKYVMGLGSPRELWPAGRQGTTSLTASSPPGRPGTTGSMSLMWRKRGQVKRPPRHKRWGKRTKGTRPKKKEG